MSGSRAFWLPFLFAGSTLAGVSCSATTLDNTTVGQCEPGAQKCVGSDVQRCGADGFFQVRMAFREWLGYLAGA